ncbi:MAG: secretin N-terminal domain-containing protein [Candidatus Omnitrophota bacterium]
MRNKLSLILIALSLFVMPLVSAQEASKPIEQNKISLDVKGMDVVDVLKMLAARAGVNIAVGKNVSGKVTLFLRDVDIWDAFEITLLSNDLAYDKKGNILNVMTQRDYELQYGEYYQDKKEARVVQLKYAKALPLAQALNQIKSKMGKVVSDETSNTLALIDAPEAIERMVDFIKNTDLPLQTRVFSLNYAQVDKLLPKLQEIITKGIGVIRIDERTNKIVVMDYPDCLEQIAKIIVEFDEKTPQVLIDAQIIQVAPSDLFEMGVDWDYWIKKYFETRLSLPVGTTNRLFLGTVQTAAPSGTGQYKGVIDILRTIGDTKVLSSPRIMVLNNQEAKIHVGVKDAYITSTTSQSGSGTAVTSQSVNFVDTGIQLYVTPTINRDGFVTMKIKPEISDSTRTSITSGGQITQIPIVSTSEAETTVMVKDGVTIIIGGLRKDKREKTVKKIPLLGDIPGLGFLFRSTSDNLTKTDLVILLTPHIITGEYPFSSFSEVPPKDGAVASMVKGNIVTERVKAQTGMPGKEDIPEYCKLIVDRIKALASLNRPKNKKGEIELSFTLSGKGSLLDAPLILKTDNSGLDPFAIQAIKSASPFPSFPQSLDQDKQTFKISLSYE